MVFNNFPAGRERAWLLIRFDDKTDPVKMAEKIYRKLQHAGDLGYVVIRADVVNGPYNIVVPVDAMNAQELNTAVVAVGDIVGQGNITQLDVTRHIPAPTYLANGFVTYEEKDYAQRTYLPEPDDTGRIVKKSPGDNPWG